MIDSMIAVAMSLFAITSVERHAVQAKWNCEPEQWTQGPVLKQGMLKGTMATTCIVTEAKGQGLVSLEKFFLSEVTGAKEVHAGPFEEQYDDLPSIRYEVTTQYGSDEWPFLVRQQAHVATDYKSRVVYDTYSSKIEAKGFASYVRKLDVSIIAKPTPTQGKYVVTLVNRLEVAKPWYAPDGIFKDEADKAAHGQFQEQLAKIIPNIAASL